MFVDYGHAYWAHMHIGPDHEGMESMRFIEHHLDELREDYGVTKFDLAFFRHTFTTTILVAFRTCKDTTAPDVGHFVR